MLELKDINCENWLKLRGGKTIFREANCPAQTPKKTDYTSQYSSF